MEDVTFYDAEKWYIKSETSTENDPQVVHTICINFFKKYVLGREYLYPREEYR